jgi:hypothetical protein
VRRLKKFGTLDITEILDVILKEVEAQEVGEKIGLKLSFSMSYSSEKRFSLGGSALHKSRSMK